VSAGAPRDASLGPARLRRPPAALADALADALWAGVCSRSRAARRASSCAGGCRVTVRRACVVPRACRGQRRPAVAEKALVISARGTRGRRSAAGVHVVLVRPLPTGDALGPPITGTGAAVKRRRLGHWIRRLLTPPLAGRPASVAARRADASAGQRRATGGPRLGIAVPRRDAVGAGPHARAAPSRLGSPDAGSRRRGPPEWWW
jgi:hypothetical protein